MVVILRLATRLAAALVALALVVGGGLLVAEVVAHLLDRSPIVFDHHGWGDTLRSTTWDDRTVVVAGAVAAAAGVLLLALALWPRRRRRGALLAGGDRAEWRLEPRDLEEEVRRAAAGVDGVRDAQVRPGDGRLRVTAWTRRQSGQEVSAAVAASVDDRLGRMELAQPPEVEVSVRADAT